MSYNTKNFERQGGAEWVVNGSLTIGADGSLYLTDKVNGKVYAISMENGVLTQTEV